MSHETEHPRGLSPARFTIEPDGVWPDTLNVTARRSSAGMSFSVLSHDELLELGMTIVDFFGGWENFGASAANLVMRQGGEEE